MGKQDMKHSNTTVLSKGISLGTTLSDETRIFIKADTETFSETKISENEIETFFESKSFGTDTDTFSKAKFLTLRFLLDRNFLDLYLYRLMSDSDGHWTNMTER